MQQTVDSYLGDVHRYIHYKQGKELADCLKCPEKQFISAKLAIESPEKFVGGVLDTPWDEIFSAHLRSLWAIKLNDIKEAYACQTLLVKTLTKAFSDCKDENWMLPLVIAATVDLRRFAHQLDISGSSKSDDFSSVYGSCLEQAAQSIMKLFQVCAGDNITRPQTSKKCGMMGLANQLFKIYFQVDKLNLCRPIIRGIDNTSSEVHFSIAQRVTYNYYVGRKAMFDGDLKLAKECLTFAFERCLATSRENKRLALIYLIPVRMLLGILPSESVLEKYDLQHFSGIVEAVKSGNVRKLSEELEEHETFFISCGIYLILEKLKMIAYRNLFKRIASIMNTHLLPIPVFTRALEEMGIKDIDGDETECILVNLIHDGKIKGYIAHQQEKLVVSKIQAFPPL